MGLITPKGFLVFLNIKLAFWLFLISFRNPNLSLIALGIVAINVYISYRWKLSESYNAFIFLSIELLIIMITLYAIKLKD